MRVPGVVPVILLAAYLPAGTSYRATTQPVAELTAGPKRPQHVRVTTFGGENFVVDEPRVVHDGLHGRRYMGDGRGNATIRIVAIPLPDIRPAEVQRLPNRSTNSLRHLSL